jgi:hypothetical protein
VAQVAQVAHDSYLIDFVRELMGHFRWHDVAQSGPMWPKLPREVTRSYSYTRRGRADKR